MLSQISSWRGAQYLDTGWIGPVFVLILVGYILLAIWVVFATINFLIMATYFLRSASAGEKWFAAVLAGSEAVRNTITARAVLNCCSGTYISAPGLAPGPR